MVEKDYKANMPPDSKKNTSSKSHAKEIIHSGHFMVSVIDDAEKQNDAESKPYAVHESDYDQESGQAAEYDFEIECQETSRTYKFGPRSSQSISIDASLTKLFECMTLAYSGKLTSPRWKTFKGLKLRLKDKIRLNNIIWRAWHIQFVAKESLLICQFATPLEVDHHKMPEPVVIEGKYWSQELSTVTAEYKKWRLFYKDRTKLNRSSSNEKMDLDYIWPSISNSMLDPSLYMDFNTALFNNWVPSQVSYDIPNPKEIAAKAGIAEFIQPGLVQLHPSLDDFMDTFQSLQDFLPSKLAPVTEELSDNPSSIQEFLTPSSSQQNTYEGSESDCFSALSDPAVVTEITGGQEFMQGPGLLDSLICEDQPQPDKPPLMAPQLQPAASSSGFLAFDQMSAAAALKKEGRENSDLPGYHRHKAYPSYPGNKIMGSVVKLTNHRPAISQTLFSSAPQPTPILTAQPDALRRHSYSTGQLPAEDFQSPPVASPRQFVMPESPAKPRVRSRSVSSPQTSQNVLPQNAMLAQLLTSLPLVSTGAPAAATTSTVTILPAPIVLTTVAPLVPQPPNSQSASSPNAAPTSPETPVNSPPPPKPFRPRSSEERVQYKEHRRVCHINAEQKRRFNIKSGFETLRHLLPSLSQSPTAKVAKAAMLQKSVEYIRVLKNERQQQMEEIDSLKSEIESHSRTINTYQSQLPASGLVTSHRPNDHLQELYRDYMWAQCLANWKFWIFSLVLQPLVESYGRATAGCHTAQDFCEAVIGWVDRHCTLLDLRRIVLNALRQLSTRTNILTNPAHLPEELMQKISKKEL